MDNKFMDVIRVNDLIFNVKAKYFWQIASGEKDEEYREVKPFWSKRLRIPFPGIQIRLGYPKSTDESRILRFSYNGYYEKTVDLMGEGLKVVFAFPLKK